MEFVVAPSPIHGLGVFARTHIPRGYRIGRFACRRARRNGPHVLWVHDGRRWNGYEGTGRLRYLNHADPPNSRFEGLDLYALEAIRTGEEITIHYGEELDWQ
jgi:SET domain-containing protein